MQDCMCEERPAEFASQTSPSDRSISYGRVQIVYIETVSVGRRFCVPQQARSELCIAREVPSYEPILLDPARSHGRIKLRPLFTF